MSNHYLQKKTFSTKTNFNCVARTDVVDSDAKVVWHTRTHGSSSPSCSDESVLYYQTWIDDVFEKEGGLYSMLSNPGPYVIWIDFDKGTY